MRLAKHLAHAGVASRRAAEQLDLRRPRHRRRRGRRATPRATSTTQTTIAVDGRPVGAAEHDARGLHRSTSPPASSRPRTTPTAADGRRARPRPTARLYPVGRLDADTHRPDPAHQRRRARQPPHAPVLRGARRPTARSCATRRCASAALRALREGVELDDGRTAPAQGAPHRARTSSSSRIHEGRKRQVRRMCEAVGHRVETLERDRVRAAAARRPAGRRAPRSADAPREVERAARALIECRRRCACTPSAAPPPSTENDADAILGATDELMREILERNALARRRPRELHLHAHRRPRRRVPRRRRAQDGLERGAAAVRPRGAGAGLAAARHPRADPLLRRPTATSRSTSTSARPPRCGSTSRARSRLSRDGRSSSARRSAASRSIPAADGYASEGPVAKLASNESAVPAAPRGRRGGHAASLGGLNRYPDPTNSALRTRLSDRYGVPANRIAIGNGSCDILLAAGDALLEPGRRGRLRVAVVLASTRTSRPPRARARSRSRSTTDHRTTSRRCARRSPSPRGWSSSATRTTRPRPRCRSRTSPRSSPTSRATSP